MIAEDTIERVRREARIIPIVSQRVKLTKKGRSWLGLCPFHKEKTPSFNVNEERGFYHCFGCDESGDAIKFVREIDGLSFIDAVRYIAEREGIEVVETGNPEERRQHAEARRRRDELYEPGAAAASFFEAMLERHPLRHAAWDELRRRGLHEGDEQGPLSETLRAFRIGYAPYGWDQLSEHLRGAGVSHQAAERVGLLAPRKSGSGHYDRFRHRLMFAVLDLEGRVIAFSGRALEEPTDAALKDARIPSMGTATEAPAKYINSPESPVYKKREAVFGLCQARQAIRETNRIVVVEGNFDVVGLHARGIENVVAPLGTAFTTDQGRQLRRFSTNVVLLFDGDSAGRRAAGAAREPCAEAGLEARVAELPDGADPDDIAKNEGPDAIRRVVGAAKGMLEYLIDTTLDRGFSADDARARAAKVREVAELIAGETDPTARALAERHADAIAERLGINDANSFRALASVVHRAVAQQDGRLGPAGSQDASQPPERARSRSRKGDVAREILGALLDFPTLLEDEGILEALAPFQGDLGSAIAAMLQGKVWTGRDSPEQLLAELPESIRQFAAARLAAPCHDRVEDARVELLDNVGKLNRLKLSRQKGEVIDELDRIKASGDFDKEMMLLREQERRARERHGL